jgi:hypothetical protein
LNEHRSDLLHHAHQLLHGNESRREAAQEALEDQDLETRADARGLLRMLDGIRLPLDQDQDDAVAAILRLLRRPATDEAEPVILDDGLDVIARLARRLDGSWAWARRHAGLVVPGAAWLSPRPAPLGKRFPGGRGRLGQGTSLPGGLPASVEPGRRRRPRSLSGAAQGVV